VLPRTFSSLNEGLGKVLRFGANSKEVLDRLTWLNGAFAASLDAAVRKLGGVALAPITAQALQMGDECHNRNVAATSLMVRKLAPAIVGEAEAEKVLGFLQGNDHFFLNLSMTACKLSMAAMEDEPGSSLVTAMARNGCEVGIRLSGCGQQWFTAKAEPVPSAMYFQGFSEKDACPDLGDSAICETASIGAFAMAASPAICNFVGGDASLAAEYTQAMRQICIAEHPTYKIPALGFIGTPCGIDALRVLDTGVLPLINTGIAHREPGVGQIGAGITRCPMGCFVKALAALKNP